MKPLLAESEDNEALRSLGRASIQIVHDLKNHLNGLKLYATFLRKRLEKDERPADELETVNKLIAGLDRTAADLSLIVEYGQAVKLNKQPGTSLEKILRDVAESLNRQPPISGPLMGAIVINTESAPLIGEFDSLLLAEALKLISIGSLKMRANKASEGPLEIRVKSEALEAGREGVIEWRAFAVSDHDPFHSFAGSNEIRLALAARIIEAHGGSAERQDGNLRVRLPLTT
jgi:signal transduction histidine kinase